MAEKRDSRPIMLCSRCEYQLKGNTSGFCSECGHPFNPGDPHSYTTPARTLTFPWTLFASFLCLILAMGVSRASRTIPGENARMEVTAAILALSACLSCWTIATRGWTSRIVAFLFLLFPVLGAIGWLKSQGFGSVWDVIARIVGSD